MEAKKAQNQSEGHHQKDQASRPKSEWVDKDISSPKEGEYVLCARKKLGDNKSQQFRPAVGLYERKRYSCERDGLWVTHWMPLPENPK